MKWIEEIKLRAAANKEEEAFFRLMDLAADVRETKGVVEVRIYGHITIFGDLVLRLMWDTDYPESQGSRVGISLKEILKSYGLIELSVWIEKG